LRNASPILRKDADGVIRIGRTRVTLESVVTLADKGAGAEEIARRFDTLTASQVREVVAFCLRHWAEVQAYVEAQRTGADAARGAAVDWTATARFRARAASLRKRSNAPAAD
jgi:uncharacterized protein (DUF433 family)